MSASRTRFFAIAALCLAAVAAALIAQYRFDMQPCPWCVLQRLIFIAIAVAALLGAVWDARAGRLMAGAIAAALAAAGMAAALWQHFVAASAASCDLTLAERIVSALGLDERWPEVFSAFASCRDAAVNVFGVPFEFYSLALFALIAATAVSLLRRSTQ